MSEGTNGDIWKVVGIILTPGWLLFFWQRHVWKKRNPMIRIIDGQASIKPSGQRKLPGEPLVDTYSASIRVKLLNTGEIPTSILGVECFVKSYKNGIPFSPPEFPFELVPHRAYKWEADIVGLTRIKAGGSLILKITYDPPNKKKKFKLKLD